MLERTPVGVLHHVAKTESTPPLFYELGWLVHRLGVAMQDVRVVSALAGAALAAATVVLARRLLPLWASALAGLAIALGYEFVFHGRELRAYELHALLTVGLVFAALAVVETSGTAADRSARTRDGGRRADELLLPAVRLLRPRSGPGARLPEGSSASRSARASFPSPLDPRARVPVPPSPLLVHRPIPPARGADELLVALCARGTAHERPARDRPGRARRGRARRLLRALRAARIPDASSRSSRSARSSRRRSSGSPGRGSSTHGTSSASGRSPRSRSRACSRCSRSPSRSPPRAPVPRSWSSASCSETGRRRSPTTASRARSLQQAGSAPTRSCCTATSTRSAHRSSGISPGSRR